MPDLENNSNFEGEDLTERRLKWGYWLTKNKPRLYQILIWSLVVFDVLLGGYNLYRWGDYLLFGYATDRQLIYDLARSAPQLGALKEHFSARPIEVEGTTVFGSRGFTDLAAWLHNPNVGFLAKFDYHFLTSEGKTETRRAFLLPLESKPAVELGFKGAASEAVVIIENVNWQRLSPHQIKDPADFIDKRMRFEASNFERASFPSARVSFWVKNNSFFNYWQVDFFALLKSGETIIGVEKIAIDNFQSGQKRKIDLAWEGGLMPNNLSLIPDLNVFDEKIYSQ